MPYPEDRKAEITGYCGGECIGKETVDVWAARAGKSKSAVYYAITVGRPVKIDGQEVVLKRTQPAVSKKARDTETRKTKKPKLRIAEVDREAKKNHLSYGYQVAMLEGAQKRGKRGKKDTGKNPLLPE